MDETYPAIDSFQSRPPAWGGPIAQVFSAVACLAVLAWASLAVHDGGATKAHLRALRDVDVIVRRETARELANPERFDVRLTIPALARATADSDVEVRAEAIHALGYLGADAIRRGDPTARDAAAGSVLAALAAVEGRVKAEALGTVSLLIRAAKASGGAGPRASWPADRGALVVRVAALLDDPAAEVRNAAAGVLALLPDDLDPVFPALLEASVREPDIRGGPRRRWASLALDRSRPTTAAVPSLVGALGSPEPRVRSQAAALLGKIGPAAVAAVPALLPLLGEPAAADPRDDPATAAVSALGQVAPGTPEARRVVEALQRSRPLDETPRGRSVAEALRRFGPNGEAVPRGLQAATRPELSDLPPDDPQPRR